MTSIGYAAFSDCTNLTSVTIPNSVTGIESYAFNGTGLTSITIPDSVRTIGAVFGDCEHLTNIFVAAENTAYQSVDGVLFTKDGTTLVAYPAGKTDTAYTIPDGVTSIYEQAFLASASLTSVTIPDSVTSIDDSAFCYCSNLAAVTIPDSVRSIGSAAFGDCTSLTSVIIPNSVTNIGHKAFHLCSSLTSATILNPFARIGDRDYDVFNGCAPGFVLHGYSGSTAETYAANAGHTFEALAAPVPTCILPAALTTIEWDAFQNAFQNTGALAVQIPASVTSISGNPFAGSGVCFIYGTPGTAAETFATTYDYIFVPVEE